MAGEYYRWLARNEKPAEKRELTPSEKRKNWWNYHKYHVCIGVLLAGIGIHLLCAALGIGQVQPDYAIAYVGNAALDEADTAALTDAFASLGQDENGDGEVVVVLNQYISYSTGDVDTLYFAQAAATQLIGDLTDCDSYFFLLADPESFQKEYHALVMLDGSLPEDADDTAAGKVLNVENCPALASLELPEGLFLGRRGFWTEKTTNHVEGCGLLWKKLTEGADY